MIYKIKRPGKAVSEVQEQPLLFGFFISVLECWTYTKEIRLYVP